MIISSLLWLFTYSTQLKKSYHKTFQDSKELEINKAKIKKTYIQSYWQEIWVREKTAGSPYLPFQHILMTALLFPFSISSPLHNVV